jgi:hypothetical protein
MLQLIARVLLLVIFCFESSDREFDSQAWPGTFTAKALICSIQESDHGREVCSGIIACANPLLASFWSLQNVQSYHPVSGRFARVYFPPAYRSSTVIQYMILTLIMDIHLS